MNEYHLRCYLRFLAKEADSLFPLIRKRYIKEKFEFISSKKKRV